ncbi:uncharacterized protein LOC141905279 [Tubulanus polymorphus]|uniref:uncharacterized protein LOC141905279 n=1 Tax=Tubulanus polymorphus TaxID=672921 RepID=UPI003DA517AD
MSFLVGRCLLVLLTVFLMIHSSSQTYELEVPANTPYSYCSVKSATGSGKQILYTSNDTDFTYFYDLRGESVPGLRWQVTIFGRFNINSETGNPQVDAVYIVVYPPSSYDGIRHAWYYIIHNDGEVKFNQRHLSRISLSDLIETAEPREIFRERPYSPVMMIDGLSTGQYGIMSRMGHFRVIFDTNKRIIKLKMAAISGFTGTAEGACVTGTDHPMF